MNEPSFHVVTDGGCDMPASLDVHPASAPLNLSFGQEQFASDALSPNEFYEKLKHSPHHPTTSQPSPEDFIAIYRSLSDKPILSIHISGGLSGTLNAARQALKAVPGAHVHLHDSKTLSIGLAYQVYAACEAARRGETLEAGLALVEQVQRDTHLLFTIDTLEYLRKGGRIGPVEAAMGSLLNLKPIVYVAKDTGTYVSVGRARSFPKAMRALVDKAKDYVPAGSPARVAVVYGNNQDQAGELLDLAGSAYPLSWSATTPVGPVLAVHTGPNALGLCVAAGPWPWETA